MNKIFYFALLVTTCVVAEDAPKMLQRAQNYCERHPNTWEGHYNLGRLYYQNSDLENAEKCFSESIQHCEQPEHQESILYNLGNTYFREAEKAPEDQDKISLLEKSIQNYEGAAALNKSAEDVQHNLNIAKKWLEKLKKKQNNQQNNQNNQKNDQQQNNENTDKKQQEGNPQEKQKESQQSQMPKNVKQQEMQNVLQKEQNNERILPMNFSNNSNLPEEKVLKDW